MANLRQIKKHIDNSINEIIYDCYMALYFNRDKEDAIIGVMREAIDTRNTLLEMVNNPADKKNQSLVKKHFAFIRRELDAKTSNLFEELSNAVK